MKIAILLCGHVRSWTKCKEYFKNTFDIDVDIFAHTYNTVLGYHDFIKGKYNIANNMATVSSDEIKNIIGIECKDICIEDQNELEARIAEDVSSYPINLDIYSQFRKFKLCDEMRVKYEKEHEFKYDIVIKTRFDLEYSIPLSKMIETFDPLYINISSGPNIYPPDQFFMGTGNNMKTLRDSLTDMRGSFPTNKKYNPHEWLVFRCSILKVIPTLCTHVIRYDRVRGIRHENH